LPPPRAAAGSKVIDPAVVTGRELKQLAALAHDLSPRAFNSPCTLS
jgi:hypothetical protein